MVIHLAGFVYGWRFEGAVWRDVERRVPNWLCMGYVLSVHRISSNEKCCGWFFAFLLMLLLLIFTSTHFPSICLSHFYLMKDSSKRWSYPCSLHFCWMVWQLLVDMNVKTFIHMGHSHRMKKTAHTHSHGSTFVTSPQNIRLLNIVLLKCLLILNIDTYIKYPSQHSVSFHMNAPFFMCLFEMKRTTTITITNCNIS